MSPLADRFCRAVLSVRESALRVAYMRHELEAADPVELAGALDDLCGRCEQADPRAREVLAAMMPTIADPAAHERLDALRSIAAERSLLPLARMLRKSVAVHPTLPPLEADARQPTHGARELTLGERKALARRPSRASLEKLMRDTHPAVIRTLLANPRLTEDDVVRMAARRPVYADVIVEIARHPTWSQQPRVRMSIVQNPGSPTEVSVPMVSLLIRPELEQLVQAADVPKVVRAAARDLLRRRPPAEDPHAGTWRVQ